MKLESPAQLFARAKTLLIKVGNGNNQYVRSHPKKTPTRSKARSAAKAVSPIPGLSTYLHDKHSNTHSFTGAGAFSVKDGNGKAVQAGKALESQGYKKVKIYSEGLRKVTLYQHPDGHVAKIIRTPVPEGYNLQVSIKDKQAWTPSKPKEAPKKYSVDAALKHMPGGSLHQGAAKTYTKDYEAQKTVHGAIHKDLKKAGYIMGTAKIVPGKSYLKQTKYVQDGQPDVVIEYHTPKKAQEKGGKVQVTVAGTTTNVTTLMKPPPSVPSKPLVTSAAASPSPALAATPKISATGVLEAAHMSKTFLDIQSKQVKGLSVEERGALRAYTGSSYATMNGVMRGKLSSKFADDLTMSNIRHATKALERSSLGVHATLYRGVKGNTGDKLKSLAASGKVVGHVLSDAGFTSTSTSQSFAASWGTDSVLLKINARPKTKGLYLKSFSQHKHEQEFLMPPNTRMVVTKAEKMYGNKVVLHVDVIGD